MMMRTRPAPALVFTAFLAAACTGDTSSGSAALDSDDQKASYGIGLNVGNQIADSKDRLDRAAFMRGVADALDGRDPAVPPEEIQPALRAFATEIQAAAAEERERVAAENREAGAAYLAENGAKEGVITTESGLQYEVLEAGQGPTPTANDRVRVHYRGTLTDGTEFDSSYGGDPAEFSVGGLIPGFTEALMLMPIGSHYRVSIPAELAYGSQGSGRDIGPDAVLIFEIELIEIVEAE